jgi:tetratricopeptide (TPR) repeat protein
MGRLKAARDGLRPFVDQGPRQGEALFYFARVVRDLGDHRTFLRHARTVADRFAVERWAEEALNSLGTHHILLDEEDRADAIFREMYGRYPKGLYAERAAWKIGWRAYRSKRYADTIAYFDRAAADFPRSDYRPSWLYWSGRAHQLVGNQARADERFMLAAADYLNSYYGRLAVDRLNGRRPEPRVVAAQPFGVPPPPLNEPIVRALLDSHRYDDALNELRYAQRAWGDSSSIQATIAWILRRQGQEEAGPEQFNLLRGSITTMRRAYPQFMAAGGEDLPRGAIIGWSPRKSRSSTNGSPTGDVAAGPAVDVGPGRRKVS